MWKEIIWVDACGEKLSAKELIAKSRGKSYKFVCLSRDINSEGRHKQYLISFFPVVHNLSHMEVARRIMFNSDRCWLMSGGGVISFSVMKKCGRNFAEWKSDSIKKELKRVAPTDSSVADWLLQSIEEFCLTG